MTSVRTTTKGAVLLSAAQAVAYACSFIRNALLARVLTKGDFGLAAAFGMAVTLLELSGRMSFGLQIVQSKHGDSVSFQNTSQAFQFIVGAVSVVLFALLSMPFARAFGRPDLWWGFALLAVIPLCRGLEHLDNSRQRRELNFVPGILSDIGPQVLVTAAAWPVATLLPDFRAVVVLMLARGAAGLGLTHVLAIRPYRWAWDKVYVTRMVAFSWPLLLNGLLLFGNQQADQMLVGSFLSLENLATYSVAFSVVSIPWFVCSQVISPLMLPILSRYQDNQAEYRMRYKASLELVSVVSAGVLGPLIVGAGVLITMVFGANFKGAGLVAAVLGASCAIRFLRLAPGVAALARADTLNQLYANLWRFTSLPLTAIFAAKGCGMLTIAGCGILGEVVAAIASISRLRRLQSIAVWDSLRPAFYLLSIVGLAVSIAFTMPGVSAATTVLLACGVGVAAIASGRIAFPRNFRSFTELLARKVVGWRRAI